MSEQDKKAENIADIVYDKIAVPFKKFMENMEEGQKNSLKALSDQISKINKRVVGWPWFIVILLAWSILMFFAFIRYHNRFLTEEYFNHVQKQSEQNDKGTTRSGHEVPKSVYEIRKDSIRDDSLKKIYR
jgi:hypothetical protein